MEFAIGFTGTKLGMTQEQQESLSQFLRMQRDGMLVATEGKGMDQPDFVLHHGDCVGADAQADNIARLCIWETELHPGTDSEGESPHRAYCEGDHVRAIRDPLPYGQRNLHIVMETVMLVAAPSGPEKRRSGTWSTVRAADKMGRCIVLIHPGGDVETRNSPVHTVPM